MTLRWPALALGILSSLFVFVAALPGAAAVRTDQCPPDLAEFFAPPQQYRSDFGKFRSPLVFNDGTPVKTPADWRRRRSEILATWQKLMGPWPALIDKPRIEVLNSSRRENIVQQQ